MTLEDMVLQSKVGETGSQITNHYVTYASKCSEIDGVVEDGG